MAPGGVRMPGGVAHGLHGDAVRRHLGGRGQSGQARGRVDEHIESRAAHRNALGLLAECGDETQLVEGRGSQVVHEPTDVVDRFDRLPLEVREQVLRPVGITVDKAGRDVQSEPHAGQGRTEPVMQVPAEAAALLLAGLHQAGARSAQRIGEARGEDRGTGGSRKVGEQCLVTRREWPAVASLHQQPADVLALMGQRPVDRLGAVRVPGAGQDAVGSLDRHVWQPE